MPWDRFTRRRTIRAFYENGACWGLGNGLVSSSLIVYLAGEYGAAGLAVSLILATPRLVGVLRLVAPLWIQAVGNRRKFGVRAYLAAAGVLLFLPLLSAPGMMPTKYLSLTALISLWTLYHFLEYLGSVAMWSWIGEAVPDRVRGRFIGRRAALLNALQVAGMIVGAGVNWWWRARCERDGNLSALWFSYAACVLLGAVCFGAAALLLNKGSDASSRSPTEEPLRWGDIFAPFRDPQYTPFLLYGGWFSLANGISGAAAGLFQMRILGVTYSGRLALDGTSQGVQSLLMPGIGRALDRWGGVPILVISQVLVALGLAFFVAASPARWWWIIGAYAFWVAYAGVSTAMPKLMLSLSRREQFATYSAAWFAWTEFVYALSTLGGGLLFDALSNNFPQRAGPGWHFDHFTAIFLLGFVLRMFAAFWATRIRHPR